jgi:hypothetical protein
MFLMLGNPKKALRIPSLAYAEQGKQKAQFFISLNFNDLHHLTYGMSMCRGTSAHGRGGSPEGSSRSELFHFARSRR